MNFIAKALCVCFMLTISTIVSAQKTEYIVNEVKGSVEYQQPKSTEGWRPLKRLITLTKASTLNIHDGAEISIYSKTDPQPLRIAIPGQNRLRTLIEEAKAIAAKSRGSKLKDIFKGHGEQALTMQPGVSYRGHEDDENILSLYYAVISPSTSVKSPISLNLLNNGEGGFNVELSNNGDKALATAIIVKIGDTYSPLSISDDPSNTGLLILPKGLSLTVPECTVMDIEGLKAMVVASPIPFSPETLCVLLNSPNKPEKGNGPENGAVAVEASVR